MALLALEGDLDGSIRELVTSISIYPDENSLNNLGRVLIRRGSPSQAVFFLELAHGEAPDSPGIRANLGTALARSGQSARAVGHLRAVLIRLRGY